MKIISYYTNDDIYKPLSEKFIGQLESLKKPFKYEVHEIKPFQSWSEATNFKPQFILERLKASNESVLWVDIDALIYGGIEFFYHLDCDIAFHMRRSKELLTGTLFFNPTENSFRLIDDWIKRINSQPGIWEQRHLQRAVAQFNGHLNIQPLTAGYCFIYDIMRKTKEYTGDIYIEHFQASRNFKKKK